MSNRRVRKTEDLGPKLTKGQRLVVLRTIAVFHDVATVQDVLKAEHPDIPELSDSQIRYYRRQAETPELAAEVQEARKQILATGLVLREVRIAHLLDHAALLKRELKRCTLAPNNPVAIGFARELRETLAQIRVEAEPMNAKARQGVAIAVGMATGSEDEADMALLAAVGGDFVAFFAPLIEQRQAKDEALAGAQRPPAGERFS